MSPASVYAVVAMTSIATLTAIAGYHYGQSRGLDKNGDWEIGFRMGLVLGRDEAALNRQANATGIPLDELILRQAEAERERERWDD